jgi:cytochrome c553
MYRQTLTIPKRTLFYVTALSALSFGNSAMETYYLQNACHSCHGMYGEGVGASPRLQGVREEVLLRRLKNLQKGKVRSSSGFIMVSFATSMDENQTIEMAKYLSTLKTKINEDRYTIEYDPAGDGGS